MSRRMREAMIADPRLPADCRHMLLVKLGEALQDVAAGRGADGQRARRAGARATPASRLR